MINHGVARSFLVACLPLLAVLGCGSDKQDEAGAAGTDVRKAKPTTKIEHNRRPQAKGRGGKQTGEELLSANLKSYTGHVRLSPRLREPLAPATTGALLFGGGEVVTGEKGQAEIAVREVGVITLDRQSTLLVPPHGECGAVLVRGAAHIVGTQRVPTHPRCFLHTPATAIWAPRSEAVVAVAGDGTTAIGSISGRNSHVDLLGRLADIEEGQRVVVDPDGEISSALEFADAEGRVEQRLRPWLEKAAAAPSKPEARTKRQLDAASRIAKRLALDVDRLLELMEQNRTLSKQRKVLRTAPDAAPDKVEQLTKDLTAQAAEMVDLQIKGLLQICRIHAMIWPARDQAAGGSGPDERIAELERELEKQAQKLPQLFEKKPRRTGIAGPKPDIPVTGPPPGEQP